MAVYGSSLADDGAIDCEEKAKILKEGWEAINQMAAFLKAVEKLS